MKPKPNQAQTCFFLEVGPDTIISLPYSEMLQSMVSWNHFQPGSSLPLLLPGICVVNRSKMGSWIMIFRHKISSSVTQAILKEAALSAPCPHESKQREKEKCSPAFEMDPIYFYLLICICVLFRGSWSARNIADALWIHLLTWLINEGKWLKNTKELVLSMIFLRAHCPMLVIEPSLRRCFNLGSNDKGFFWSFVLGAEE